MAPFSKVQKIKDTTKGWAMRHGNFSSISIRILFYYTILAGSLFGTEYAATQVTIPNQSGVTVGTLEITDLGTITDLNIQLTYNSSSSSALNYLTFNLLSPSGTAVALINQGDVTGASLFQTLLDDQATTTISNGSSPYIGSFIPANSLSSFNDETIAGTWEIVVYNQSSYTATLDWSLYLETDNSTPTTPPDYGTEYAATQVSIPNQSGVTVGTLEITDLGTITDLNIQLTYNSSSSSALNYLTFNLLSPSGTAVALINQGDVTGASLFQTLLDDQATTTISNGSSPYIGSFIPANSLSSFNDETIAGTWEIVVYNQSSYTATLDWSLYLETDNSTPTTPPDYGTEYAATQVSIPNQSGVTVGTLEITDLGTITDLNIQLTYNSSSSSALNYLTFTLLSPSGTAITIINQGDVSGASLYQTLLDNQATTPLSNGVSPYIGSFLPANDLSALDCTQMTGTWQLVINNSSSYTATIDWSIIVKSIGEYLGSTFHVSPSIENCSNGSIDYPFGSIQTAIDASSNGDTILVQPGTYVENINFNGKNIVVGSLYLMTQDSSCISQTVIDGNNNGSVVIFENNENSDAKLIGLTIKNGDADVYSSENTNGGGIRCINSNPHLSRLVLINNTAKRGGALYLQSSNLTLLNTTIINNEATDDGGGLHCMTSNPIITNVIINNNTSSNGGGVYLANSDPQLTNVIISSNDSNVGAGILCQDSSPNLTNVTISNNSANYSNGGGAIRCWWNSGPTLVNTIIWNNQPQNISFSQYDYPNTISISYSIIQGGDVGVVINNNGNVNWGSGNISSDPLYIDADNGNYNIVDYSPCIGAGLDTIIVPITDIDGNPRPNPAGSSPDIGAYENPFGTPQHIPITINIPADYATIQAGLNAADSTDTVLVQLGTYPENIIWPETNGIMLLSAGDSSTTIIDGSGMSSVIYMNPQTTIIDSTTLIQGFKITNGGNVTNGGGIFLDNVSPTIKQISLCGNSATMEGGGIYLTDSAPILMKTFIANNSAQYGSGMYLSVSSPSITGVVIKGNSAVEKGGGLYLSASNPTLLNVVISENDARCGGGIYSYPLSNPIFNQVIVLNNSASNYGGGMCFSHFANPTFIDVTVVGNSASQYGGGICLEVSTPNISSLTLIHNTATQYGGAMYLYDSSPTITNATIIENGQGLYVSSGNPSISYSNIISNGNGLYNSNNSNIISSTDNFWGYSSGPYHPSQNPSGTGDSTNLHVNVTPWLTAPSTEAPPIPAQNTAVAGTGNDFISLSWDTSLLGDFSGFNLYYDSDSSGFPYANFIDVGTDTSYTLTSLDLGTEYYLAVTTYDIDGNESWYSNEVTGITRVMQAHNLIIPGEELDHLINHTPTVTFEYFDSMSETQTHYKCQVSTFSDFSTADLWDSGEIASSDTSITYAGSDLLNGATYHLRIKVGSNGFWSDWSTMSFRMNSLPSVPYLESPIDNHVVDDPIELVIRTGNDGESDILHYQYFVFDDNSREVFVDSSGLIPDTTWQVQTVLNDNNQYWWYAKAYDGFEFSDLALAESFLINTENNVPGEFILTSPASEVAINTLTPTFYWSQSIDPDPLDSVNYTLVLDTPEPGVLTYFNGNDTTWVLNEPLADNQEYFWKIIATDILGFETENIGGYFRFLTNQMNENPSVVDLISPDSVLVLTLLPEFHWTASIDPDPNDLIYYEIHWWNDYGSFDSVLTDTNYTIATNPLQDNSRYSWEVLTMDNNDGISHSSEGVFWTDLHPEPMFPFSTINPENNAEGLSNQVEFIWNQAIDPDPLSYHYYRLTYATDWSDSSTYIYGHAYWDTSFVLELEDNSEYFWMVEAIDDDDMVTASNDGVPFRFVVGMLSTKDKVALPSEIALHQNYPNPFNPVTAIQYDLPEATNIQIVVYDLLGRQVAMLKNGIEEPGYKQVIWDATNNQNQPVGAGVYFYRIKSTEFVKTRKMLLLK